MAAAKLELDRIVDEAIALMEEAGLEAVSLRRVAARLDAKAPSLYRHFRDKDELHALMSYKIFQRCLERIPVCTSWPEWLEQFGRVLLEEQQRTPGALQLISANRWGRKIVPSPPAQVIDTIAGFGLDRETAILAQESVQALVTGWTMMHPQPAAEGFHVGLRVMIEGWRRQAPRGS